MKNYILLILGLLLSVYLISSVGFADSLSDSRTAAASEFDGVNWADPRDNYVDGWIIPSGLNSNDTWNEIHNKSRVIFKEFKSLLGANTVRVGINPPTVLDGDWWERWIGIIKAAQDEEMKVIIGCWDQKSSKNGLVEARFKKMWKKVIARYGNSSFVYFEIFNEPFGYSKKDWKDKAAEWIGWFPDLPKGRIIVSGSGYSAYVIDVAEDSRFDDCLFSQHIYPWFGKFTTEDNWKQALRSRVGNAYKSRTIVTEYGAAMTTGMVYKAPVDGNKDKSFIFGISNQIRDWNMGSIYWPGLRDGDRFSLTKRNGTKLTKTNETGVFQVFRSFNK